MMGSLAKSASLRTVLDEIHARHPGQHEIEQDDVGLKRPHAFQAAFAIEATSA